MDSQIGLIIQLNGVILITILSLCLRRSLQLTALKYWTMAWLCLSFALICLRLGFSYPEFSSFLFTYYFLGEYLFGFMLVAGCRSLDGEYELKPRTELLLIPIIIGAVVLPHTTTDLYDILSVHSLFLSAFFATAFYWLRKTRQLTFGWRLMHVSLALLTVNFFLFALISSTRIPQVFSTRLLAYNSIVDLVLQTALGVGMVLILLEKVLNDFKDTNEELLSTQKKLEQMVNTDPLTAAFNRHAFYGFVRQQDDAPTVSSGCVGFFDIDDLKAINDCFGHAAGDMVIRHVVRSIREIIRAEDLIYRWGGDEFFVIMVSMRSEMAESRMMRLDTLLEQVYIDNIPDPINVAVSWGFTDYSDPKDLENAIKAADGVMYQRKQMRKQSRAASIDFINSIPGSAPGFVR
jgi:diguanylate cyclase (GGDEF)-like protein